MDEEVPPPEVPDGVTWLYYWDWYDGPLSGAVTLNGERLWAGCVGQDDDYVRAYDLFRRPKEWWDAEDTRHALFCAHVGTHFVRHQDGSCGVTRPQEEHHKYYDAYPPNYEPDEKVGEVVGRWRDR